MNYKKTSRCIVLVLFLVATILSVLAIGQVKINYNISDYLDDSTETKISLDIMGTNFDMTGNIQVMVEGVSVKEANEISTLINGLGDNVLLVNFDDEDPAYYNTETSTALFAVVVKGDEYSDTANEVLADIKAALDARFEGRTNYGGAVVEKANMRKSIQTEIVVILAIALVFAVAIMLLMAKSWIEPLVLLFSSCIAVVLNMGTNFIFKDISYITNAVAAILQLALSVDYSIILLHEYRNQKSLCETKEQAMAQAVKKSFSPIVASAFTTMAGLIALYFMTMEIGIDIGRVLTKGIAISAITAITLLPAILLCLDKVMTKIKKRSIEIKSEGICKVAFKASKPIVALVLVVIVLCGVLQTGNTYLFTDSSDPNQAIIDTFGTNSTLVVVYPKLEEEDEMWAKEAELAKALGGYSTASGKPVLLSYTAYSNTVREEYSVQDAMKKFNLSKSDAEFLFALYHEHDSHKMTPIEFVIYTLDFLENDPEAKQFASESTLKTLQTMSVVQDIMNYDYTAKELHTISTTGVLEGTELSEFQIKQMYGLYLMENDGFVADDIIFLDMLDYILSIVDRPDAADLMNENTVEDLTEFSGSIYDFKKNMETMVSKSEFQEFATSQFGGILGSLVIKPLAGKIFDSYIKKHNNGVNEPVQILSLLEYTVNENPVGSALPGELKDTVANYAYVYHGIHETCAYDEFIPLIGSAVLALTGETREIDTTVEAVQQAYIMYYTDKGTIPDAKLNGREFIKFVNDKIETNHVVRGRISEDSRLKLLDLVTVDNFLCDDERYLYNEMSDKLIGLQNSIKSLDATGSITPSMILNIYAKYTINDGSNALKPIVAEELLYFVVEQMDSNEQLASKITEEHRAKIEERLAAVESARKLFVSDKDYARLILSIDLPSESEESTAFVGYLLSTVKEIFGENGHITGHMVSTVDLQNSFETDNRIITIVTIISIFVIIMLIFKSLSLPILLVLIIQGAIWISMSASLITGPMFFMSYIITTCILMGATIDYGILMSNTYVNARATLDKKEALNLAVKTAIPTIFTSGIILTVCGFIVGFVASQLSISTVGYLLGKGALVSSLMVTFVLPSVLYALDGFIIKLSVRKKEKTEKENA